MNGERIGRKAPECQMLHSNCPVPLANGPDDRTVLLIDAHGLHVLLRCGELLTIEGNHDIRVSLAAYADRQLRFFGWHLNTKVMSC